MNTNLKTRQGFTLIEIIVVVAVIGLLSVVAMASLSQARMNARDKVRISDLEQAKSALHLYAVSNGTYEVEGAGYSGQGWLAYKNGSTYPKSIAEELVAEGILTSELHDPMVPAGTDISGDYRQYTVYFHSPGGATKGICIFAKLERPTAEYTATVTAAPLDASARSSLEGHGMNYATCTQ